MRTKRMRDPEFRKLEARARKLNVPFRKLWAARSVCPACGVSNLSRSSKMTLSIICSGCKQQYVAEAQNGKA
jgi:hypothetical protein